MDAHARSATRRGKRVGHRALHPLRGTLSDRRLDPRYEPFFVAAEVILGGGDTRAIAAALDAFHLGRAIAQLRSLDEYRYQLEARVIHPDDDTYGAKSLSLTRSRVRSGSHGEGGEEVRDDGLRYPSPDPLYIGSLRDNGFFAAMEVVDAEGDHSYPVSAEHSLDTGFDLDPVAIARAWSQRTPVDPLTDLGGVPRILYDEAMAFRRSRPLMGMTFHEEGDPHHGAQSHGAHILWGRITYAARKLAAMELALPGTPEPYQLPMLLTFTPHHHPTELWVPGHYVPRSGMLHAYKDQFTGPERGEFLKIDERLSWDRSTEAVSNDLQQQATGDLLLASAGRR